MEHSGSLTENSIYRQGKKLFRNSKQEVIVSWTKVRSGLILDIFRWRKQDFLRIGYGI